MLLLVIVLMIPHLLWMMIVWGWVESVVVDVSVVVIVSDVAVISLEVIVMPTMSIAV